MNALPPLGSYLAAPSLPAPKIEVKGDDVAPASPDFPDLFGSMVLDDPAPDLTSLAKGKGKPERAASEPAEMASLILAAVLQAPVQPPNPPITLELPAMEKQSVEPRVIAPQVECAEPPVREPQDAVNSVKPDFVANQGALEGRAAAPLPILKDELSAAESRPPIDETSGLVEPRAAMPEPDEAALSETSTQSREPRLVARATRPKPSTSDWSVTVDDLAVDRRRKLVEPQVLEDRRFVAKPRIRMAEGWRSGLTPLAEPGAAQSLASGEDAGPGDEGRDNQEPSADKRAAAAGNRPQGDPRSVSEPRGEMAFSARLVPIAAEAVQALSQPTHPADTRTPLPEPGRPSMATAMPETPQPPKSLPVRELRLEVDQGERKVEVHLIERAGDVHVAVRTPDVRLAGEIRENLPALSSRLEQTGYRTETWQGSQDRSRHAQDEREHPQRQQQTPPEELPKRKHKGQPFAWLMASLR